MCVRSYARVALLAVLSVIIPIASQVGAATQLTGAGSTFDYPFFSRAFYDYSQQNNDVTVNYQSIGSGGGIQQFIAKTVDFGASDVPADENELKQAGQPVLQIPVTLGSEAIGYNLPGIGKGLRLTRESIAAIYLGKITQWNDAELQKLNPDLKLPALPIVVVHRSDGSGTTYIFTDFLSAVSPEWKEKVGIGKSVQWPVGIGGKGNEGVAGQVRQTPGAIGYVELAYVLQNDMPYAQVRNRAGRYLYPSLATTRAAAATKPNVSSTDFSIVDAPGANAYPIAGYSWVMLYETSSDPKRAALVKAVMTWLVTKGQADAAAVDYVPLPDNVQRQALKILGDTKSEGAVQ
ncbi:MAG TPA: phosphate ABC transporter substrate-binding protein PstS [Candidatus Binataceae bacterium]|nr:phosphate ABC transporter substrate-binding protein PstS [Candidatus Binataceae bacterium]